jgi:Putative DNA-binding domain
MPGLKELQNAFKRNVTTGDEEFGKYINSTEAVSSDVRLGIYANAYFARLEEALESDYEILKQLLGDDVFEEVCMAYTHKYPSHYYSLRWFGQDFPTFLGYLPESGEHHWPAEMAQLEWSFVGAFDAADAVAATETDAAAVPPEAWAELKISFHPSVRTMAIWWNTLPRWRAAKNNEAVPEAVRLSEPAQCLLWRQELITQYRSMEADEAVALQAALAGTNFSELCGVLAEEMQDQEMVPMKAAGFLKSWLAAGMITEFCV